MEFTESHGWLYSLHKPINFVRRTVTTSRPVVTETLWIGIRTLFLHDICTLVQTYNIPDELIINVYQTPSKYVPTSSVSMAEKNPKNVPKQEVDDKRAITLTFAEALSGDMLPFQMIYADKTSSLFPTAKFSEGFLLGFNKLQWSNEKETLRLLKEVISPYITKVKKKFKLPQNQTASLIWDAFKAQSTGKIKLELEHLNIKGVEYQRIFASTFRLNDKRSCKEDGEREFSDYFTN